VTDLWTSCKDISRYQMRPRYHHRLLSMKMSSEKYKSYFIAIDEISKVSVRNVFQDNAVVIFLENHRVQLDNVGVVQLVWLRLTYQLIMSSATNKRTSASVKDWCSMLLHGTTGPRSNVNQIWGITVEWPDPWCCQISSPSDNLPTRYLLPNFVDFPESMTNRRDTTKKQNQNVGRCPTWWPPSRI